MELCQRKVLHQRAVDVDQAMQGSEHSSMLPELTEHWGTALRDRVWVLCGPGWSWELDGMIFVWSFQLGVCYDSLKSLVSGSKMRTRHRDRLFLA